MSGPWSREQVGTFLKGAVIPLRLSAVSAAGWPAVVSLWFEYRQGIFYCASRRQARIVELLRENPKCGFEVAGETPPYHGIRGQGMASLHPETGQEVLVRLVDRYLGPAGTPFRRWLLAGAEDEVAIAIRPVRLMSWDYRARMEGRD